MKRSRLRVAALCLLTALSLAAAPATGPAASPPAVGDVAKDFALDALSGGKVKLADAADKGPVVLVVLRGYPGYQCPICTRQFAEYLTKADAFKAAGATVLFVYPGPPENLKGRADEFVKGKDYPDHYRFLLDPGYEFTDAYGLRWEAANETAYPSTFVLEKGTRKVKYAKVSKTHGGRAPAAEVLKALGGE